MESPNVRELIDYMERTQKVIDSIDVPINQMYDTDYIKDSFNDLQFQIDKLKEQIEVLKKYIKIIL